MIIKIDKAVDGGKQEQLVKVQEKKSGSRAPRMYYRKQKKNVEEAKGDKEQKIQPMVVKIKEKITDIWDNMGQITNVVLDKAAERIKTIKTKKIQSRTMGYAGIIAKDLAMKASLVSIGALNNYADSAALSVIGAVKALKSEFSQSPNDVGKMKMNDAMGMLSQGDQQGGPQGSIKKSFNDNVIDNYVETLEKALSYDGDDDGINILQKLIEMADKIDEEVVKNQGRFKAEDEKKFDEGQIKLDLQQAEKILKDVPHHFKEALIKYRNKRRAIHNTSKKGE